MPAIARGSNDVPYPAAILLDLDDTIVAFDSVADMCWRSLCNRYAHDAGATPEGLFAAISRIRQWYWSDPDRHRSGRRDLRGARQCIVSQAFVELGLPHIDIALQLVEDYSTERLQLVAPFPGAIETLKELQNQGVALALLTNGDAAGQRAKIQRFDLVRYFSCIVIEEEFGTGKPDAAVFQHALRSIGHNPEDAWMIGNSLEFDIAPALELGMQGVLIDPEHSTRTEALHSAQEYVTISTLAGIREIFGS